MALARQQLASAWRALGRVRVGSWRWSGAWLVVSGALFAATAWVAARAVLATGVVPAVAVVVAVVAGLAVSRAVVERGVAAAAERWFGVRWAGPVAGGVVLARVVALWAIAPAGWLGALCVAALLGRWGAVVLQRLGDVVERAAGLAVGEVGWLEAGVLTALAVIAAAVVAGWAGVALVVVLAFLGFGGGLVVQAVDGELTPANLAVLAAALELVALVALSVVTPAAASPFVR